MQLRKEEQEFALHWTDVIRKSNSEMAYQFVSHAPSAVKLMGIEGTRQWLLNAMDIYDREGLYPGSAALDSLEDFASQYRLSHLSVRLDQIRNVLETFIFGLAGRKLKLEPGKSVYTDTNTLFLPERINRFNDREKNYQLYKAIAVHLWAQTWFGTFKRKTAQTPHLSERLGEFDNPSRALRLFNILETIRLNACIQRELPGLSREILSLADAPPIYDATWKQLCERLKADDSTVEDTLESTRLLIRLQTDLPEAAVYQAGFDLDAAKTGIETRLQNEKEELQELLSDLMKNASESEQGEAKSNQDGELELRFDPTTDQPPELLLDGEPLPESEEMNELIESMMQDLEKVPDDWLIAAEGGDYRPDEQPVQQTDKWQQSKNETTTFIYDEWDFRRQTYRKDWCVLRELPSHPVYDDFYARTMEKHFHLVGDIRRHFEALRGEDKILKAEPSGDNIDIDALITAYADMQTGVEMSDRLFTKKQKVERDLAVIFMVDVSGSTKGWINEAERESLILLCEALEILGDRYAIYGFSGMTRNRCEVYNIKDFHQPYDRDVRARISGLRPQDYTRMGVTIRHLTAILNRVEARTRVLITLSDGKPDDYDGYRGEYGIEDTRQALLEARHMGVHPFCITIDTEASDYLPHMYGAASYVLVDEVRKLPLKVADIYRRLTT